MVNTAKYINIKCILPSSTLAILLFPRSTGNIVTSFFTCYFFISNFLKNKVFVTFIMSNLSSIYYITIISRYRYLNLIMYMHCIIIFRSNINESTNIYYVLSKFINI